MEEEEQGEEQFGREEEKTRRKQGVGRCLINFSKA